MEFFIKMSTYKDDLVLDIFSDSNTTGYTAEKLNRRRLSFDMDINYIATSSFRFINLVSETVKKI
jgi:site-specific DNA-methyltransferase (cytosine-N4-specific)